MATRTLGGRPGHAGARVRQVLEEERTREAPKKKGKGKVLD